MKGSPNQLFIDQRTQQAIRSLEGARLRAQREHTLIGVALVVSRVQVNQLVRSLPLVRAAIGSRCDGPDAGGDAASCSTAGR